MKGAEPTYYFSLITYSEAVLFKITHFKYQPDNTELLFYARNRKTFFAPNE
jgi:hypothetical protein